MVLAILMAKHSIVIAHTYYINGACHLMAKHSIVIAHTYSSSSSSTFISARYSSHSFCHRAMNEVSKRAA